MLGSKTKSHSAASPAASLSIIGTGVNVVGNVTAAGDLHLDGTLEGDVSCASFTLGASGRVTGHVKADKAQLAGQVEGTIAVRELVVEASARLSGDLSYESVSIATGAHVDGRVSHRAADEAAPLKLVAHSEE